LGYLGTSLLRAIEVADVDERLKRVEYDLAYLAQENIQQIFSCVESAGECLFQMARGSTRGNGAHVAMAKLLGKPATNPTKRPICAAVLGPAP